MYGLDHPNASRLAIYYSLIVQSKEEIKNFESICLSAHYFCCVDKKTKGFVNAGEDYEYDDDT